MDGQLSLEDEIRYLEEQPRLDAQTEAYLKWLYQRRNALNGVVNELMNYKNEECSCGRNTRASV